RAAERCSSRRPLVRRSCVQLLATVLSRPTFLGMLMVDNQSRTWLARDIHPDPLQKHPRTQARLREELEMNGRPGEKSRGAAQLELAALHNRIVLADNGHAAFVEVSKWHERAAASQLVGDVPCDILPLLDRDLCHAREWPAILLK